METWDRIPVTNPELRTMPFIKGIQRFFRLRWMYVLKDRPRPIFGQWNGGQADEFTAGKINKYGLSYAAIQGELANSSLHTMFECDGHDYVLAQWMAAASVAPFGAKGVNSYKSVSQVIGLAFLTREYRIGVFVNGQISKRPLTDKDKKFRKKEHSI